MSAVNCTQSKEIKIIHIKLMTLFICHKKFILYLGQVCPLTSNRLVLCWQSKIEKHQVR